jgi:hypothetical protein
MVDCYNEYELANCYDPFEKCGALNWAGVTEAVGDTEAEKKKGTLRLIAGTDMESDEAICADMCMQFNTCSDREKSGAAHCEIAPRHIDSHFCGHDEAPEDQCPFSTCYPHGEENELDAECAGVANPCFGPEMGGATTACIDMVSNCHETEHGWVEMGKCMLSSCVDSTGHRTSTAAEPGPECMDRHDEALQVATEHECTEWKQFEGEPTYWVSGSAGCSSFETACMMAVHDHCHKNADMVSKSPEGEADMFCHEMDIVPISPETAEEMFFPPACDDYNPANDPSENADCITAVRESLPPTHDACQPWFNPIEEAPEVMDEACLKVIGDFCLSPESADADFCQLCPFANEPGSPCREPACPNRETKKWGPGTELSDECKEIIHGNEVKDGPGHKRGYCDKTDDSSAEAGPMLEQGDLACSHDWKPPEEIPDTLVDEMEQIVPPESNTLEDMGAENDEAVYEAMVGTEEDSV